MVCGRAGRGPGASRAAALSGRGGSATGQKELCRGRRCSGPPTSAGSAASGAAAAAPLHGLCLCRPRLLLLPRPGRVPHWLSTAGELCCPPARTPTCAPLLADGPPPSQPPIRGGRGGGGGSRQSRRPELLAATRTTTTPRRLDQRAWPPHRPHHDVGGGGGGAASVSFPIYCIRRSGEGAASTSLLDLPWQCQGLASLHAPLAAPPTCACAGLRRPPAAGAGHPPSRGG